MVSPDFQVCVTLYDWRTFPEQFAKSRDLDEKALYQLLTKQVGPTIIAALVEKAQELARQEAVLNRKRSSRIATIQLSKEEAIRAETAQREMEERMERQRYEETRHEREAAALARAEQARDDRLREREERALAREEAILARARDESEKAEKAERDRQERARRREEGFTVVTPTPITGEASGGGNGSQADRWELNCEVCKKTGWNVDDDEDVVACEDCGRWQHMGCHDMQDMREGRKKRNWEKVDFRVND
jgi:flagellar biosynthesis GTPase FlhF